MKYCVLLVYFEALQQKNSSSIHKASLIEPLFFICIRDIKKKRKYSDTKKIQMIKCITYRTHEKPHYCKV